MKKVSKKDKINGLMVDIVEYAFTEWLARRGLFDAFKRNYESEFSPYKIFRDDLRVHIHLALCSPNFTPRQLLSSAFVFASTPEGSGFWHTQSDAWERFYLRFLTRL